MVDCRRLALLVLLATLVPSCTGGPTEGRGPSTIQTPVPSGESLPTNPPALAPWPCQPWLRTVLFEVGGPGASDLQPGFVKDALGYSTLRIDAPSYGNRFDVTVFAEEPDTLNVQIETIPVIARRDGFALHYTRVKGPTQQFLLASDDVWITMHVVPESDRMSVQLVKRTWFPAMVHAVGQTPPPDCEP
jgi:hypothetical protein